MRRALVGSVVVAVVLAGLTAGSEAEGPVVVDSATSPFNGGAANQGWWSATAPNVATNATYLTGSHQQVVRRGFFSFDLSGLTGRVAAVRLEVNRGRANSTDASEMLEIFDVSTPAATLNAGGASQAIFDDLGSGRSYGTFAVSTSGLAGDVLGFDLGPAAVEDAQAARGGWFSVGLSLVSDDGDDHLFGVTAFSPVHRLVIELAASIPVEIDVQPGSDEAVTVPPHGNAPVAVAIFGSDELDVTALFVSSLRFGPAGAAPADGGRVHDVDEDGREDLVVRFPRQATGLEAGTVDACLGGETLDAIAVEGCQVVEVRSAGPPPGKGPAR